jgi:2-oxo-4-hydroxy-4-carboxy-5-ureidoimidazoline decarboxylase
VLDATRDRRTKLSARSAREQGDDDAPPELDELNRAYEDKFGFRFVVFVAGRPKRELVPILCARLERTRDEELTTALEELVAIAEDRWRRG